MKLDEIENSLNNVITNINKWKVQGFIPSIQVDATLNLLQNAYELLNQLNTSTPNTIPQQPIPKTPEIKLPTTKPTTELTDGYIFFNTSIQHQLLQQFIDELFWRDKTFFDNEISKFEKLTSLDDALIYIGEKYNWTPDNKPAEKFIEILDTYYSEN